MNGKTKQIISIIILLAATAVIMYFVKGQINLNESSPGTESITENDMPESTEFLQTTQAVSDFQSDITSEITDSATETENEDFILEETPDAGNDYISKIVFIGDKTIYQLGRYSMTGIPDPVQQVWSVKENIDANKISSVNTFLYPGTLEAMNFIDAAKRKAPPFIILTFGSYDPNAELTRDSFFSSLSTFVVNLKGASPNSQIIVQSIFPTGPECEIINSETVKIRNSWLRDFCSTYELYYLNTWSVLTDENGYLRSEYYDTDGYLLNEAGYTEVVNYVKTHVHPSHSE